MLTVEGQGGGRSGELLDIFVSTAVAPSGTAAQEHF